MKAANNCSCATINFDQIEFLTQVWEVVIDGCASKGNTTFPRGSITTVVCARLYIKWGLPDLDNIVIEQMRQPYWIDGEILEKERKYVYTKEMRRNTQMEELYTHNIVV